MSDTKTDALAVRAPRTFSLMPSSLGEAREIAQMIAGSDFAPKDYKGKPDNIVIAIQMGSDIGLSPMQALQNIAVINGRPSFYGDAALALAMPALERFHETFEGAEKGDDGKPNDDFMAVCIAKRKGWPDETRRTFSVGDAKKANLWGKAGPWTQYPKRMLQFRARGFTLRDVASDLLLGLVLAEEAQDYPSIEGTVVASEIVHEPAPALVAFEQVSEGLRTRIEEAFATLNIANGLRLAKLNQFIVGDGVDPEAGAQALLDWCKDEWAKRKTGKPRAPKGNGKEKPAEPKAEKPAMTPSELPPDSSAPSPREQMAAVMEAVRQETPSVSAQQPPPPSDDDNLF